jgi:hypothetical protein
MTDHPESHHGPGGPRGDTRIKPLESCTYKMDDGRETIAINPQREGSDWRITYLDPDNDTFHTVTTSDDRLS